MCVSKCVCVCVCACVFVCESRLNPSTDCTDLLRFDCEMIIEYDEQFKSQVILPVP